jgi:hypothetical protein
MIFITIGPIELNISSLISFSLGILTGFLVLFTIYMYAIFLNIRKEAKIKKADQEDIDENMILLLIEGSQNQFKDKKLRNDVGFSTHLYQVSQELIFDISHKFYPESKTPYLELTLDETLLLNHYITDRVDHMTKHPLLKLFRRYTLSSLYDITTTTKKVKDSKIVKKAQELGVDEVFKASISALNVMNPVYWIRRFTNEQIIDRILVKIGAAIIAIVGEETYKIYSKKVFQKEETIHSNVDDIYEDINQTLEEAKHDRK